MKYKISFSSLIIELIILFLLLNTFDFSLNIIFRICIVYLIIQTLFGHYTINTLLIWDEIESQFKSNLSCLLVSTLFFSSKNDIYVFYLVIVFAIMFIFNVLLQRKLRHFFRKSCAEKVLLIGTENSSSKLINVCKNNRFSLKDIKYFINLDKFKDVDIFDVDGLLEIINKFSINSVIIAAPNFSRKRTKSLIKVINKTGIKHISYTSLIDGVNFDSKIDDFDGQVLVTTSKGEISFLGKFVKRLADICSGICGCIILVPLTLIVFVLNRINHDKSSIFFVQERIGTNGNIFKMYKFRSMFPDAENKLNELIENNPRIKNEYLKNKKITNDPRITRVGKYLRELSLDEFPQFINVLKGEMSLIGPRPYLPKEKNDMGYYYDYVIKCKPGITGMWQTHGRSDISFSDRLEFDEYYQRNWSLKLDITILIKTFKTLVSRKGAK